METMLINGRDIHDLGAHVLAEYKIGGTNVDTQVFAGRWRTHFDVLEAVPGLRPVQFTLVFTGADRREAFLKKSQVDAMLSGKCELLFPDGIYYTVYAESLGDLVLLGNNKDGVIGQAAYKMSGIAHGEKETTTGADIFCRSTMPRTDCKVTCTATADAAAYTIHGVTFTGVSAGDVLCADGINGRLLVNGAPAVSTVRFMSFPYLVPGWQTIEAPDAPTVEYYPAYI